MKPYYQADDVTILHADVRDGLKSLADESVHLVVTSPPYFGLRQYAGVQPSAWGGSAECEWLEARWYICEGRLKWLHEQLRATGEGVLR